MTNEKAGNPDTLKIAALGIGGAGLAFVLFGGLGALGSKGSGDPYDAMPKTSFLVATVDLDELRRSPVYEVAFGKEGSKDAKASDPLRSALGMQSLADACGFDPLARVQKLAVSLPEDGERGEFGLAARVDVTRDELEKCTKAISDKHAATDGAKVEAKQVGSFAVVEASGSKSRIGYGSGGLLVVGKGAWFDAMIGAADHKSPGARDAQDHAGLRTSLTSREGWKKPTVIVTALLPKSIRERLKGEMGAEVGAVDPSSASMGGVLGVSAIGVAINAGGPGRATEMAVELACDSGSACEAVEKLVLKKRLEWSKELTLRMVGLGPLIDSVDVKRDGSKLRATAASDASTLAGTLERILKLRGAKKQAPLPPIPRDPPPPDESIPSKKP